MANPISNRIYQRIGYRHIGDQQKILFQRPDAK
jgi:predicted GNAT family acetyltransferase